MMQVLGVDDEWPRSQSKYTHLIYFIINLILTISHM